jgi:hypothetical protein
MNLNLRFEIGDKVKIFDTQTLGIIQGLYITSTREVKYDVHYWNGSSKNSDYFLASELSPYRENKNFGYELPRG